jgi:hypothetical protein
MFSPYVEMIESNLQPFSESGIVNLIVGIAILVVSNSLAYLLVKSFNLQNYFGRFLGGIIILFITLLLSLSTHDTAKFRASALFGIGEIIIGTLDIISNKLSTSLPLLIPDPGCGGGGGNA